MKLSKLICEAEFKCPAPTQDIDLNLENRNKAFKEYMYGPSDPRLDLKEGVTVADLDFENLQDSQFKSEEELKGSPNYKYWKQLQEVYNADTLTAALKQRCGNCAAFVVTNEMKDCIEKGIGDNYGKETVVAGEIGYCQFLKFKCAAARTCEAWVGGGPIKDQQ